MYQFIAHFRDAVAYTFEEILICLVQGYWRFKGTKKRHWQ